jgi:hypothetical protein
MSSDIPRNHGDPPEEVVDVSYMLTRSDARSILRGFWSKRLLKISPGLVILLVVFMRAVGPPYVVSFLIALLLCALTLITVMTIWDHRQLKAFCRQVRVSWSPTRVQVGNPQGTKPFLWSEVTGCKLSGRFLSTSFTDGSTIHVPKGAFTSEGDPERILKLANAAAATDIQKRSSPEAIVTDVRKSSGS